MKWKNVKRFQFVILSLRFLGKAFRVAKPNPNRQSTLYILLHMQSSQYRSTGENQLTNYGRKAPKTVVFSVPSAENEFRLASTKGHWKGKHTYMEPHCTEWHDTTLYRMSQQAAVNSTSKYYWNTIITNYEVNRSKSLNNCIH